MSVRSPNHISLTRGNKLKCVDSCNYLNQARESKWCTTKLRGGTSSQEIAIEPWQRVMLHSSSQNWITNQHQGEHHTGLFQYGYIYTRWLSMVFPVIEWDAEYNKVSTSPPPLPLAHCYAVWHPTDRITLKVCAGTVISDYSPLLGLIVMNVSMLMECSMRNLEMQI